MIPQIQPWIDEDEVKEVMEVVRSTWITESKKTKEFEDKFKELTGANYAYAFCNGTATLFTALKVLGIGNGDEVIVPNLTFVASVNAIILAGATPVLVDIDPESYQIDPQKIEEKITQNTRAIMPVHLYGLAADMEKIMSIAQKYNLKIVEDAAQGVGVKFSGRHVGTFGDFGSFSFYGNKTITTGEGGMIITNDETLANEAYRFKNHGRLLKGVFVHEKVGFNFSITEMQAAMGVAQLRKLDKIIAMKNDIRERYIKELSGINAVKFTKIDSRCEPVHWFTNIIVDDADKLAEELKKRGIQTRKFFYPINKQECYKHLNFKEEYPNTEFAYKHCLSLPSSANLTEEDQKKVCDAIREIYR